MSKERIETITCPTCGKRSEFTIWESINTMIDPQMKAAVRDLSAFQFTCPKCGDTAQIDYGFLYHQMEDKIMIQYAPTDEYAEQFKQQISFFRNGNLPGIMKTILTDNYLIRMVRSKNELLEKLAIFDAGLDDRIIEIYKASTIPMILAANGKEDLVKDLMKKADLFFARIGQKNFIEIYENRKLAARIGVDPDLYELDVNISSGILPDLRSDELIIDRDYAFRAISKIVKNQK